MTRRQGQRVRKEDTPQQPGALHLCHRFHRMDAPARKSLITFYKVTLKFRGKQQMNSIVLRIISKQIGTLLTISISYLPFWERAMMAHPKHQAIRPLSQKMDTLIRISSLIRCVIGIGTRTTSAILMKALPKSIREEIIVPSEVLNTLHRRIIQDTLTMATLLVVLEMVIRTRPRHIPLSAMVRPLMRVITAVVIR